MQRRRPPPRAFEPESPTKPSASHPFGKTTGVVPRSRRDPSELVVEEAPRASQERPAVRPERRLDPPDEEPRDEAGGGDAVATPRAVTGGIALESVPRVVARRELLVGLGLDHRTGFVLACIDGESTVQTLIDIAGLPPAEVVGMIRELVDLGVVVMG